MHSIIKEDIGDIINEQTIDWKKFDNSTVLITGANGMLPSYMVFVLLELRKMNIIHCKVLALVRNIEKARKVFSDYSEADGLFFINQDVSSPIDYSSDIDYIIHAASQASPLFYGTDPVGTLSANIFGTINLLNIAVEKRVKHFLYYSSSTIYGNVQNESCKLNENDMGVIDPLNIRNCYSESKRMGENMCSSYAYQFGVPASIVRIFHTLGPMININDGRAFSDFVKCVVNNENIVLHSNGHAKRTFCYVSDAIKAFFLVLLNGVSCKAYNVGGGLSNEISMNDLAHLLISLYPQKQLKVFYDINPDNVTYGKMKSSVNRLVPDLSEMEALGWKQTISIAEAFRRTIMVVSDN